MQRLLLHILVFTFVAAVAPKLRAELPPRAAVPPTMEIEVLDPNVDPNGNPAVLLKNNPCSTDCSVDIPPVVLVHRYYYTGNRSFQGPMLPGGPSIAVINHPKTGERCYVPLQMMPGAPVVRYRSKSIEYDFGKHGVSIIFGTLSGLPTVKYRNHEKISGMLDVAFEASKLPEVADRIGTAAGRIHQRTDIAWKNGAIAVEKTAKAVVTPVIQVAQVLPLGKMIFSPNPERTSGAYAEQFRHDKEVRQASAAQVQAETSLPTNR